MKINHLLHAEDIRQRIQYLNDKINWANSTLEKSKQEGNKPNRFLEESIRESNRELTALQKELSDLEEHNTLFANSY